MKTTVIYRTTELLLSGALLNIYGLTPAVPTGKNHGWIVSAVTVTLPDGVTVADGRLLLDGEACELYDNHRGEIRVRKGRDGVKAFKALTICRDWEFSTVEVYNADGSIYTAR